MERGEEVEELGSGAADDTACFQRGLEFPYHFLVGMEGIFAASVQYR